MYKNDPLTAGQALQKLRHYCGYQERCHQEVKEKLFQLGVRKEESGEIIAKLIEDGYLNEERFAKLFAGGKFRQKKWGRIKIINELKKKGVSDYCIRKGMKEIDEDDYLETLRKLYKEKSKLLARETNPLQKTRKIIEYLQLKGFERGLIQSIASKS